MTSKTKKKETPLSFDDAIKQIEDTLVQLENQDISLESSLAAFETGINLIRQAQDALSKAEQKVRVLSERNGEIVEKSMDLNEGHE